MGILSFVDFQVLTRDARGKFGRVLSSIHTDVLSGRTFSVLGTFLTLLFSRSNIR